MPLQTCSAWVILLTIATAALRPAVVHGESEIPEESLTLEALINLAEDHLAKVDIATMNLLAAEGLPGSEKIDIPSALAKLDRWAAYIKWQTDRHLYRLKDPQWADAYARSEARLRMEMIVGACQQDFRVPYNEAWIENPTFDDSANLFIHGMLGYGHGGTCGSMPVLYVAIGRRLGYPMFLVQARQHVFCRWDGWGERVNMDGATSSGIGFPDDEYYHDWPKPLSEEDLASGGYLTSLNPARELALFLHTRGICLGKNQRFQEAREALLVAARLAPSGPFIQKHLQLTDSLIEQSCIRGEQRRVHRFQEQASPSPNGRGVRDLEQRLSSPEASTRHRSHRGNQR